MSSAPLALKDETGASNGATVTWHSDNNWSVPITDVAGNARMVRGYLDTGSQNPSTVNISGLPTSSTGYDVYIYTDGDNGSATVTATYSISGSGITTTSVKATDPANVNFSGTFTQANNSNGNYVKFSSIQATSFTITATPTTASDGALRAPLNGIQIVPTTTTVATYTISGQVTISSGTGLGSVTVSLSTGATTTTDGSGNYSFAGLPSGNYTVTPSATGYQFTPNNQTFSSITSNETANFTASTSGTNTPARAVSIDFVGNGTVMGTSESAGVVAKTNWNNAINSVSSAPLTLVDETGASNGATVTWHSDNNWSVPITDVAGNVRMVKGYLDTGSQNPSTVNISGLPASSTGYDVYVYTDGDNGSATVTGTYSISGGGITTTSVKATDPGNVNFSGTFTQANNSNGNYVKFTSVQGTSFTITATPTTASDGALRAPLNGIQIVPSPAATAARAVSIDFVGNGTAMGSSETAGVVAKTNWNNANNNVSGAPLSLIDETGVSNGATVTWHSDNSWSVPITDVAGNARMIKGYLDTGSQNPTTVNVAGLPASSTGYDVYVYTDGDNASATVTGTYSISGAGITTASVKATDPGNVNYSGAFTQANNSNGNYVKFSSIQATAFTVTATPTTASDGALRAPVNGIQVVPH